MKILFVTPTWPDPPNSGAKARMISILKLLKQTKAEVILLYVDVNMGYPNLKNTNLPVDEIIFLPFRSNNLFFRIKKFLYGLILRFTPAQIPQKISLRAAKQKFTGVNPNRYADPVVINKIQQIVDEKKIDIIWFNYA